MLHGIRHVHLRPVDTGLLERLVEHGARRPDEGSPDEVLAVARLLADQHDRGAAAALTEHALRGARPEVARATGVDRVGDPGQVVVGRPLVCGMHGRRIWTVGAMQDGGSAR